MMKIIRSLQRLGQAFSNSLGILFILGTLSFPYLLTHFSLTTIFWSLVGIMCTVIIFEKLYTGHSTYLYLLGFFTAICIFFFTTVAQHDGLMMMTYLAGPPVGIVVFQILKYIHQRFISMIISLLLLIVIYMYIFIEYMQGDLENPYTHVGSVYAIGVVISILFFMTIIIVNRRKIKN